MHDRRLPVASGVLRGGKLLPRIDAQRLGPWASDRARRLYQGQRPTLWVPGVAWGAPALGCSFEESLKKYDELKPIIRAWSPDALLHKGGAPIYFENNWGLTQPPDVQEMDYKVHSPAWALGFQTLTQQAGVACFVHFPGHPTDRYKNVWDFVVQELKAPVATLAR